MKDINTTADQIRLVLFNYFLGKNYSTLAELRSSEIVNGKLSDKYESCIYEVSDYVYLLINDPIRVTLDGVTYCISRTCSYACDPCYHGIYIDGRPDMNCHLNIIDIEHIFGDGVTSLFSDGLSIPKLKDLPVEKLNECFSHDQFLHNHPEYEDYIGNTKSKLMKSPLRDYLCPYLPEPKRVWDTSVTLSDGKILSWYPVCRYSDPCQHDITIDGIPSGRMDRIKIAKLLREYGGYNPHFYIDSNL